VVADGLHTVLQSARSCPVNACKSRYLQLWGTTHKPKVAGSNPAPATKHYKGLYEFSEVMVHYEIASSVRSSQ
jgi:hypothetical protein